MGKDATCNTIGTGNVKLKMFDTMVYLDERETHFKSKQEHDFSRSIISNYDAR